MKVCAATLATRPGSNARHGAARHPATSAAQLQPTPPHGMVGRKGKRKEIRVRKHGGGEECNQSTKRYVSVLFVDISHPAQNKLNSSVIYFLRHTNKINSFSLSFSHKHIFGFQFHDSSLKATFCRVVARSSPFSYLFTNVQIDGCGVTWTATE